MPIDPSLRDALAAVTTSSLARALARRGLVDGTLQGIGPGPGGIGTVVGEAATLRLIPSRGEADDEGRLAAAVEAVPKDAVVVVATAGSGAAVLSEAVAARLRQRGAGALVTDGAAPSGSALPVWSAPSVGPSGRTLVLAGSGEPVALGAAAVHPGDILVADAEGVVVIPPGIAEAVALEAVERQRLDLWILREIEKGTPLPGLSPPDAGTLARYEAETRPD